ncbi:dephospho-CoA kinase [Planktosalinus lacus]|uniref:Dephospho-CoA kinase n=1 Tax=Planktosalinus lacus TaxID=1526573 RepID=A0A8J2V9F3_9FLAO|nr:dephospho-CoA kinase [Planktosalinus lacus]GGD91512.1 dephospho-CoA kinase [Planktosalinus lacus]
MKIIGLTGGIGSGKSTVANMFRKLGIAIYIADDEAKKIMHTPEIKQKVISLLGEDAYLNNKLNRAYIASNVFKSKELLNSLNEIVHPAVAKDFKDWAKVQKSDYVIKEAAILFENEGYKNCDFTILVTANKKLRLKRILKRDNTTVEDVIERMQNQWPDSEKVKLADFVITNNEGLSNLKRQVYQIHEKLMKLSI